MAVLGELQCLVAKGGKGRVRTKKPNRKEETILKKVKRAMVEEAHQKSEAETPTHVDNERPVREVEAEASPNPIRDHVAGVGAEKPSEPDEQIFHVRCHSGVPSIVLLTTGETLTRRVGALTARFRCFIAIDNNSY